jgi:hypothetical protein
MDAGLVRELIPVFLVETGTLIFYCGIVAVTLLNHEKRVSKIEDKCEKCKPQLWALSPRSKR